MHSGYLYISRCSVAIYIFIYSVWQKMVQTRFKAVAFHWGGTGTKAPRSEGASHVSTVHCGSSQICGENSNQLGARHCKQRIIKNPIQLPGSKLKRQLWFQQPGGKVASLHLVSLERHWQHTRWHLFKGEIKCDNSFEFMFGDTLFKECHVANHKFGFLSFLLNNK